MDVLNLHQKRPFFDGTAAAPFTLYISSPFVPYDKDGGYQRFPSLDIDYEAKRHDRVFRNFKASNLHALQHEILSLPCQPFLRSSVYL
jgi:hypothetical protein